MNNFTKEELEWLYHEVEIIAHEFKHTRGMSIPIKEKLQSMIDNYCEHQNQSSMSDIDYVYYCRDCNQITDVK